MLEQYENYIVILIAVVSLIYLLKSGKGEPSEKELIERLKNSKEDKTDV